MVEYPVSLEEPQQLEEFMTTTTNEGWPQIYDFVEYDGTDPMYIGEVAANGSWRIMEYSSSAKTMRYCVGLQDYADNWADRALLTYSLPDEV